MNKLNCIMLVDDDRFDNLYHERVIRKSNLVKDVIVKRSADEALEYLRQNNTPRPNLIFLDINMPGTNGWEFLDEFSKINQELRDNISIVMLSTSDTPEDEAKAKSYEYVSDFKSKPLTNDTLEEIIKHL